MVAAGSLGFALSAHFGVIGGPDFREGLVVAERPLSLDPLIGAGDPAVHDVGHLLYRSLLKLDSRAYPAPDLASAYTVSTDGLAYSVTLASGHHWSDGRAITSADVLATVAFAQSSRAVDRRVTAALRGVTVAQKGPVITFTLPAPLASFGSTLTQLPILPLGGLSAHALDAVAKQPSHPMKTSGPFSVQSANSGALLLVPNLHAQHRPRMSQYQLVLFSSFNDAAAAFARGDVDALLATTPAQRARLLRTHGAVAHDISTFRFVDVLFNEQVPGLDDAVVRRAIAAAVNRLQIVESALHGAGGREQVSGISQGLPWVATRVEPASVTADATAALDAAGWTLGAGGERQRGSHTLAFTLDVSNADPLPTVARELAAQLTVIGINVHVRLIQPRTFVPAALETRSFQLALGDWDAGPDPDVSSFWRSNAVPPQGFNVAGGPTDPFLDRALDSLATLNDPQARVTAAQDVSRFLASDAPAIFLYTPEEAFVTRLALKGEPFAVDGGGAARYDTIASWRRM